MWSIVIIIHPPAIRSISQFLQEEVTAACQCQNDEMYPLDKQEKPSCDEDISKTADERIVGYINTMKAVEEGIMDYEIPPQFCR